MQSIKQIATEQPIDLFKHYGRYFRAQPQSEKLTYAFKDHSQFQQLQDIVGRRFQHHALINYPFSAKLLPAFLTAFANHLNKQIMPALQHAEIVLLDHQQLSLLEANSQQITAYFKALTLSLNQRENYLMIALPSLELFTIHKNDPFIFFKKCLQVLTVHPKIRFILFSNTQKSIKFSMQSEFATIHLGEVTEGDLFSALNQECMLLQEYYHLRIPSEVVLNTMQLGSQFLGIQDIFLNSLLLIDSAAARLSSTVDKSEEQKITKTLLTLQHIINVLAIQTQIPSHLLDLVSFNGSSYLLKMQQYIFGQDAALHLITDQIQSSQAQLQPTKGVRNTFIFSGASSTGKKTTARCLSHTLFGQKSCLFHSFQYLSNIECIDDLKFLCDKKPNALSCQQILMQKPYAIFLIEDVERASIELKRAIQEILVTGFYRLKNNIVLDFRSAIFILTTTLGAQALQRIAQPQGQQPQSQELLQLLTEDSSVESTQLSSHELADEILPDISKELPQFVDHATLIPFMPHNVDSLKSIFQYRLKRLGQQLEEKYRVPLGFAPEIIRYLSQQTLRDKDKFNIKQALKELYHCLEQAVLSLDEKNKPEQWFLKLNELGTALRCEGLRSDLTRQHTS